MTTSMDTRSPSLDALCFAHYGMAKHACGGSLETFGEHLREAALGSPTHRDVVRLSHDPDVAKRFGANGKTLRRFESDRDKMQLPGNMIFPWVWALQARDPEQGFALRAAICNAIGMLPVRKPAAGESVDEACLSLLCEEFSDLLGATSKTMADGVVDERDLPYASKVVRCADDLIAAIMSVKMRHQAVIDRASPRVVQLAAGGAA